MTLRHFLHRLSSSWLQISCYILLSVLVVFNVARLSRGDLIYHTDIARDFLILDEMVSQKKLSLIGARTSLPGVFHGPAWYYLNLPVFFLSHGNPVASAWFWLVLTLAALASVYFLSRQIFASQEVALLGTTFLATHLLGYSAALGQQSGALFLSFVYLFCLWLYLRQHRPWQLVLSLFVVGLIIQFQMAFGVPILLVTGLYLLIDIIRQRRFSHLFCFAALLLPLSTFVVFDLRHDFLQLRAVFAYFQQPANPDFYWSQFWSARLASISECFTLVNHTYNHGWSTFLNVVPVFALLVWSGFLAKKDLPKIRLAYRLSLLMIIGFWLVTLPYKGTIWGFYHTNLWPLIFPWLGYVIAKEKHFLLQFLFVTVLTVNLYWFIKPFHYYWSQPSIDSEVYWRFYRQLSQDLFQHADQDFGYYVFTPDLYGYQVKYALKYFARQQAHQIFINQKLPLTYLIMISSSPDTPEYDNVHHYQVAWHDYKVGLTRTPDFVWRYPAGYWVENYYLTPAEIQQPDDPYLFEGLEMR